MSDYNFSQGSKWIRFSVASTMRTPVLTNGEFFEEEFPCTVWGRWNEDYGVLWLECVMCDDNVFDQRLLSDSDKDHFTDILHYEICTRYF